MGELTLKSAVKGICEGWLLTDEDKETITSQMKYILNAFPHGVRETCFEYLKSFVRRQASTSITQFKKVLGRKAQVILHAVKKAEYHGAINYVPAKYKEDETLYSVIYQTVHGQPAPKNLLDSVSATFWVNMGPQSLEEKIPVNYGTLLFAQLSKPQPGTAAAIHVIEVVPVPFRANEHINTECRWMYLIRSGSVGGRVICTSLFAAAAIMYAKDCSCEIAIDEPTWYISKQGIGISLNTRERLKTAKRCFGVSDTYTLNTEPADLFTELGNVRQFLLTHEFSRNGHRLLKEPKVVEFAEGISDMLYLYTPEKRVSAPKVPASTLFDNSKPSDEMLKKVQEECRDITATLGMETLSLSLLKAAKAVVEANKQRVAAAEEHEKAKTALVLAIAVLQAALAEGDSA